VLDPTTAELGPLVGETVELRVVSRHGPGDPRGYPPGYVFAICGRDGGVEVGRLLLRVDEAPIIAELAGHLAYEIAPEHRGHRYAAQACTLVARVAKLHGLVELWSMCADDNVASLRTLERAGFEHVDTRAVPRDSKLRNEHGIERLRRYRLRLG
jgi:predicted acetyltransferase